MKRPFLILVFFGLSIDLFAQLTYEKLFVDYDSAWQYKNLKIIPIRFKGPGDPGFQIISLSQALQRRLVSITERGTASTENVHWLRINNRSKIPLFIGAGEIIKGGRQDRIVTRDTVMIPNGTDQYFSVMCVEEGRWTEKEKKFIYSNFANPRLRRVIDQSKNQVRIWKEISDQLDTARIHSPTLAYTGLRQDKKHLALLDEYSRVFLEKFKKSDSTITGIVCMSGDEVIGSDVFAGTNLFYEELGPILVGYIENAVLFGKPVIITDKKVKLYMDKILTGETSQEEYLKKNGKIYRYKDKVIHFTSY